MIMEKNIIMNKFIVEYIYLSPDDENLPSRAIGTKMVWSQLPLLPVDTVSRSLFQLRSQASRLSAQTNMPTFVCAWLTDC